MIAHSGISKRLVSWLAKVSLLTRIGRLTASGYEKQQHEEESRQKYGNKERRFLPAHAHLHQNLRRA